MRFKFVIFRSAKKCNAVDFCISDVWESHYSVKDSDAICDDCKEWVGKARSFIENKDTSDEVIKSLKFTCGLIPVASLQTSCEKLVDENVPEILKMLESSMDPDAVCSKLKFCNNAEFDKVLKLATKEKLLPFTCSQCNHIGSVIEQKFTKAETDEVLEKMLGFCGELSSFSDSCSTIIMMNFDDIHKALKEKIHANNICSVTGACEPHQRAGIADIILSPTADPNIVCDLCEQTMLHLRELLIINTSEVEFKNMMIGFCHQMGKFNDECTQITDQYYDVVYKFLENNLSANKTCIAIGICKGNENDDFLMPVMPLVSVELHPMPQNPPMDTGMIEVHMVFEESSLALVNDGAWCTTCEYVVHFIQEALAKPSVDTKLEDVLKNVCKTIPKRFQGDCVAFVDLYGDAMMSLWGQSMDARLICPKIKMCPPNLSLKVLQDNAVDEKPTCPFCLMALQEVHDLIESNKTKANIQNALSKLCNHLSDKLMSQCTEFVKDYTDEVVDMLLADFTPQDACIFITLCSDNKISYQNAKIVTFDGDFDDSRSEILANPQCDLCKEIVKIVEQRVININSKDEIRRELENSCDRLKKFSAKCKSFVDKYSDRVVDMIERELAPEQVCKELTFCVTVDDAESQDYDSGLDVFGLAMKEPAKEIKEAPQCVICEFVISELEKQLNDSATDDEIKNALLSVCSMMPQRRRSNNRCPSIPSSSSRSARTALRAAA